MCTLSFVHLCYFYKACAVFSTKALKKGEEIMQSTICSCTNLQIWKTNSANEIKKKKDSVRWNLK